MLVQVGDQVRGRDLRPEEVDPPATQPQDLRQQPGGQSVPLAVHAGQSDSTAMGYDFAGGVVSQRGDDAVVDGRGRVLLRDADAVGGPFGAHLVLDGGDHLQQHLLGRHARIHRGEHGGCRRVLVAVGEGPPEPLADHDFVGGTGSVWGGHIGVVGRHATYLPRVWPSTALR